MSDKYKNENGVYIDVKTDKKGKDHINIYDKDPSEKNHKSIHINYDSKNGKGTIVDTTNGNKESTDIKCYLTTACMKHTKEEFDDNCYELMVLRWFRDNFVSSEDIMYYYQIAPLIVEAINKEKGSNYIYRKIYQDVISECVKAIENEKYDFAYERYQDSVIVLEEEYVKPRLRQKLIKILKKSL